MLVALLGVILAVRVSEFPIINSKEFLFNEIFVTSTFWFPGVGVGCSFWFSCVGVCEVLSFLFVVIVCSFFSSSFSHIAFKTISSESNASS